MREFACAVCLAWLSAVSVRAHAAAARRRRRGRCARQVPLLSCVRVRVRVRVRPEGGQGAARGRPEGGTWSMDSSVGARMSSGTHWNGSNVTCAAQRSGPNPIGRCDRSAQSKSTDGCAEPMPKGKCRAKKPRVGCNARCVATHAVLKRTLCCNARCVATHAVLQRTLRCNARRGDAVRRAAAGQGCESVAAPSSSHAAS